MAKRQADNITVGRGWVSVNGEVRQRYQIIDIHGFIDCTSRKDAIDKAKGRSCMGKVLVRERTETGWKNLGTYLNGSKTLYPCGF